MSERSLQRAYTVWAPIYDALVALPVRGARRRSVELLAPRPGERVLIDGIGTGLDLVHLPRHASYVGVDLTPAMLERAKRRGRRLGIPLESHVASAESLPLADGSLDAAILHLIVAVVPDPVAALREVARVLRRGGRAAVLDKFVARGARPSLARRTLDRVFRPILTGVALDLYEIVAAVPELTVTHDEPALVRGVWRIALLERRA